jgi:hypothetical protein
MRADDEREEIWEALLRVCGLIDARVLKRPGLDSLLDAIDSQRPHILHFIGHGHRDELGSVLEFAPDGRGGDGWQWRAPDMASDLQGRCPRLVVVNACRAGQRAAAAAPGEPVAWDLAHALMHVGVRAVIAMQGDIDSHAAVGFSRALYGALADDAPLDGAVAAGRRAIRALDADAPDRWLPTLTLAAPPDRVLPLRCGVPAATRAVIERAHSELGRFVDCSAERRRVWEHAVSGDGVLVIDGAKEVGKSALARWCVGAAQLAGVNGAYVAVGSDDHAASWPALLRATARALVDAPLHGARNRVALEPYLELADDAREDVPAVFARFRAALKDATDGGRLLIAVDCADWIEEGAWNTYVRPQLIQQISAKKPPVTLLLVASDEARTRGLAVAAHVGLRDAFLPVEEFALHASRFLRAHAIPRDEVPGLVARLADPDAKGVHLASGLPALVSIHRALRPRLP